MNSIKRFISHCVLSRSFDTNLDKLFDLHRDGVIKRFDLPESNQSYWIDCTDDYAKAPEMINEEIEFHGSLEDQINAVIKHWEFFPESVRHELKGLLPYILYLRSSSVNGNAYTVKFQNEVRDNIYEM